MEDFTYHNNLKNNHYNFEARCARCGACCGALDGDPCSMLEKTADGKFFCTVYSDRLGPRKTVGGKFFTCVPIRDRIREDSLPPNCAYKASSWGQVSP